MREDEIRAAVKRRCYKRSEAVIREKTREEQRLREVGREAVTREEKREQWLQDN